MASQQKPRNSIDVQEVVDRALNQPFMVDPATGCVRLTGSLSLVRRLTDKFRKEGESLTWKPRARRQQTPAPTEEEEGGEEEEEAGDEEEASAADVHPAAL